MAKKKKKKGAYQWSGYPPGESEEEAVNRLYKEQEESNTTKRDTGFYGHCKCQTLF